MYLLDWSVTDINKQTFVDEKTFLIFTVCSDYNHVRTWNVTRFRGMLSTQPGSAPLASFKVVSLERSEPQPNSASGNLLG